MEEADCVLQLLEGRLNKMHRIIPLIRHMTDITLRFCRTSFDVKINTKDDTTPKCPEMRCRRHMFCMRGQKVEWAVRAILKGQWYRVRESGHLLMVTNRHLHAD